jgi:hypothetical protein
MQQLYPSSPHSLVSGIASDVDPTFASMQQGNTAKNDLKVQLTTLRSNDRDNLYNFCPVFRVCGRPPIDGFMKVKRSDPKLWLANQPRTDAAATQDKSSALAPDPSSGALGLFPTTRRVFISCFISATCHRDSERFLSAVRSLLSSALIGENPSCIFFPS